jgi:hypothetical protein
VLEGRPYDGYIRFPDQPDPYPGEDTFSTREEGTDTYGVIVYVGRVQFIEGYPMQPQRNMPPWGFQAPGGTLPVVAAPNEPIPPANDDLAMPHVTLVRWNCCCGQSEEFIYTEASRQLSLNSDAAMRRISPALGAAPGGVIHVNGCSRGEL